MLAAQPTKPCGRDADEIAEAPSAVTLVGEPSGDRNLRDRQIGFDDENLARRAGRISDQESKVNEFSGLQHADGGPY